MYTLLAVVTWRQWSIGDACRGTMAAVASVDGCDNDFGLGFPVHMV